MPPDINDNHPYGVSLSVTPREYILIHCLSDKSPLHVQIDRTWTSNGHRDMFLNDPIEGEGHMLEDDVEASVGCESLEGDYSISGVLPLSIQKDDS